MGFRFRRTIGFGPFLRFNLSKSGVSTSIGVPGARRTFSRDGVRDTVGLPGTGLSYTTVRRRRGGRPLGFVRWTAILILACIVAVVLL